MKIAVRFLKRYWLYNRDEVAGFEEEKAAALVDAGVAVIYTTEADYAEQETAKVRAKQGKAAG